MNTPLIVQIPRFRVLIVEDDKDQAEHFRNLIKELGSEFGDVKIASSLAGTYDCLEEDREKHKEPFHVVLVDMGLPEGEEAGLEVIELLRNPSRNPDPDPSTDIVVVTSIGTLNNVYRAIELGANQYLAKGLTDFDNILKRVVKERAFRAYMFRGAQEYFYGEQSVVKQARELLKTLSEQPSDMKISEFHPEINQLLRRVDTLEADN